MTDLDFLEPGKKQPAGLEFLERAKKEAEAKSRADALLDDLDRARRVAKSKHGKGSKSRMKGGAKTSRTKRAKRLAKKIEARKRLKGALNPERKFARHLRRTLALPGWKVLAARMKPGKWYEFAQLVALMPEYSRNSVKAWAFQMMPRKGVIDRTEHPAPDRAAEGGWFRSGPSYLYRINSTAGSAAQEWRKALGMVQDTGQG